MAKGERKLLDWLKERVLRRRGATRERKWEFGVVFDYLVVPGKVFDADGYVCGKPTEAEWQLADPTLRKWLIALIASLFVGGAEGEMLEKFRWTRAQVLEVYAFWRKYTSNPFGEAAMNAARAAIQEGWPRKHRHVPKAFAPIMAFHALVLVEDAWLGGEDGAPPNLRVEIQSPTREPWVTTPIRDYLGLALSGGGIRSATFNLGLLQALAEKGVLAHVDYLSTVSGGGYVGGFWSAWRAHHSGAAEVFPVRPTGPGHNGRERAEVRHLREFSRFLIPRVGFGQSETWLAVSSVLGGTLVSLLVMIAAVAACLYAWFLAGLWLAVADACLGAVIFGAVTLLVHVVAEYRIDKLGKLGSVARIHGFAFAAVAALMSGGLWWFLAHEPASGFSRSRPMLDVPLVWTITTLVLLLLRVPFQRFLSARAMATVTGALDRAVSRCLAPALGWAALCLVWWAAARISKLEVFGNRAPVAVGVGSAGAAGLFVWLRDWLKAPVEETRGTALLVRLRRALKPLLPQVAAVIAVVLFLVAVALLIHRVQPMPSSTDRTAAFDALKNRGFILALAGSFLALWVFDPARTGLHEFYRARIARCFLGAARADLTRRQQFAQAGPGPKATPGAATVEQEADDLRLGDLRKSPGRRPMHLVCCAANNLGGDVLGSLYRGARSAVLSPFGVSVGNFAAPRDDLSFSAALTASAAAFNSQMGEYSMRLGPAVAFVMCALNLRLGLWVPHPLNVDRRRWWVPHFPGWYFFLEALGISRSDQVRDKNFFKPSPFQFARKRMKLHLSDGGHFENLGIYELVRRHCRYIIASDASADPTSTFDDLGNAIRRVREDFGVEIEIDVTPLRAGPNGHATRHAVMGTIHFDGLDGTDKGSLIYFKPNLTGDEPADVLEYRARKPAFPHDGTGDQFYDEAQWESYRRLGQHAGSELVAIDSKDLHGSFVDKLFLLANQRLQVATDTHRDAFLRLTERCAALEGDIRDNAPAWLRAEFFPEVAKSLSREDSKAGVESPEESTRALYFLMQVAQVMEDVWLSVDLDHRWAHPLNEGWMNYFRRWTSTPSFRTWWPVLRPIYCPQFRDFVKERFDLRLNEPARQQSGPGARLALRHVLREDVHDESFPRRRSEQEPSADSATLVYELELERGDGSFLAPVQVGYLFYSRRATGSFFWEDRDLVLIPALSGAGIQSRFLDSIVDRLGTEAPIEVRLEEGSSFRSPAQRSATVQRISFYKSRGFHYETRAVPAETWLVRPKGPLSGT